MVAWDVAVVESAEIAAEQSQLALSRVNPLGPARFIGAGNLAINVLRLDEIWSITEGIAALAHDIMGLLRLLGWRPPAENPQGDFQLALRRGERHAPVLNQAGGTASAIRGQRTGPSHDDAVLWERAAVKE
jgi:hypothetical protein